MVGRKIGEGAEAKVFETRIFGIAAVVKSRGKKGYRIPEIDEMIRNSRTKTEARILCMVHDAGIRAPRVLFVLRHEIFMTYEDGSNFAYALASNYYRDNFKTITQCGEYLGKLHGINVVHGDYTPANVLVKKDGTPTIMDFGLAEVTSSIEGKALDVLLMKRSVDETLFKGFIEGYRSSCNHYKQVLEKLADIERRGRYQTRTLSAT